MDLFSVQRATLSPTCVTNDAGLLPDHAPVISEALCPVRKRHVRCRTRACEWHAHIHAHVHAHIHSSRSSISIEAQVEVRSASMKKAKHT